MHTSNYIYNSGYRWILTISYVTGQDPTGQLGQLHQLCPISTKPRAKGGAIGGKQAHVSQPGVPLEYDLEGFQVDAQDIDLDFV